MEPRRPMQPVFYLWCVFIWGGTGTVGKSECPVKKEILMWRRATRIYEITNEHNEPTEVKRMKLSITNQQNKKNLEESQTTKERMRWATKQKIIKVIDQPPHIIRILCEQEGASKKKDKTPGPAIDVEVTVEPWHIQSCSR